jgi:hypothetical protein
MSMLSRFDLIIQQARAQGTAYYEADPKSFGGPGLFRDCLLLALQKYPDIEIAVSGSDIVLSELGLASASRVPGAVVPVRRRETDFHGFVRLTFGPRREMATPASVRAERAALASTATAAEQNEQPGSANPRPNSSRPQSR